MEGGGWVEWGVFKKCHVTDYAHFNSSHLHVWL